ncbi:NXPE family member 3-like [Eucyclogobius newberryi]|uniref:NXPE family member 3-like n=1 Tax=Eucyclogobius newberryi TaxID=166745 RepID=UPI003B58DA99
MCPKFPVPLPVRKCQAGETVRAQASTGVRKRSHLPFLVLGEHCPQSSMTCTNLQNEWEGEVSVGKGYNSNHCYKTLTCFPPENFTGFTKQSKPEVQKCTYNYLSPENTVEGRRLLDSITWPETLPLPKPFSLDLTTSASKSTFSTVPRRGGWRVGDKLTVTIQVNDYHGNPKKGGGDFLIARLQSRELGAGVVGQVKDHLNGTFTALFPLLWKGTADVEVRLVQSSESITVLKRLTEEQPDRLYFGSDFKSRGLKETTTCNVCLDPHKAPLCNFTDLKTGEPWFCYKPKKLDCDTRVNHFKRGFSQRISKEEEGLFQKGINMNVPLMALGNYTITILPKAGESNEASPGPSGYYFNNQWRPIGGRAVRQFNKASVITSCLKGKQLYLFGDSTIRQYYLHITKTLPNLQTFDKHSSPQGGPFLAVDHTNDIVVNYRCHGPPIRFGSVPVSQLRYVANELDMVTGGPGTVVVVGVWSHFSTFPMEVYSQRLLTIRRAAQRLLDRAPGTKVIVRTSNMKDPILLESLSNSDWYSLQRDKVLRAVFKDTGLFLLDAWEMGQAHYLPNSLHPQPEIIKLMIDGVLSHTCPGMGE